jgi:LacI family transcriptional regulator
MALPRQTITIRHVAEEAKVSMQTVSRVLNNEPSVSEKLKTRVNNAIKSLNYVPSLAAQSMRGAHSFLILALNDRERTIEGWRLRLGTDWVDQMLLGGMLKSAEYGYRLLIELVDTHNHHVEREILAALSSLRPDGVILTPPHSDNLQIIELLTRMDICFARMGSNQTGPGISLYMDEIKAADLATEHLLALGHRDIAFIGGSQEYSLSHNRHKGWKAAMQKAGFYRNDLFMEGNFTYGSGEVGAKSLLSRANRPTAIIANNDQIALASLKVATEMGLKIPQDLSLISFDNSPVMRFTQPPLSAIDQPIAEITAQAVEQIILAKKSGTMPICDFVFLPKLIERASTSAPPKSL